MSVISKIGIKHKQNNVMASNVYMYVQTQPELCGFVCVCSDIVYACTLKENKQMVHPRTQLRILTFSRASENLNIVIGITRSFLC